MTQGSLLEWSAPVASPKASEQGQNLARVGRGIGPIVIDFCRLVLSGERGNGDGTFHGSDLSNYVANRRGGSLSSPDRILRELRRGGFVSYVVVNRAQSLYRLDGVKGEP